MIRAGILAGSGYMGGEVLRVLLEHPDVEIAWVTSRGDKPLAYFHKNLYGVPLRFIKQEDITPCDVVFSALPTGETAKIAGKFLAEGTKVIDLGADFRLKSRAEWERVYGKTHGDWDLAGSAVYGIPELHRAEIVKTSLIANPGCLSSASILGLAPLVRNGLVDLGKVVVDGLSGTTGAGAELHRSIHHPEIANNIVPYNVVDHRHTYEIEQELGLVAGTAVTVHFTPMYVPISRGILCVCHGFLSKSVTRSELLELYREFYRDEYFIRIMDFDREDTGSWQTGPYPWVAATSGTNFCHIGLDIDEKRNRAVVFSALDSIGKGGAHAAVQNMNLIFGLPEKRGLERSGLHPY